MTSPDCTCTAYSGPFGTDIINPGNCPVHLQEPIMNDPHRPVCPTGVVPSRLRSDQPTLLQPWTAREEEELQTARAKLQALEGRRTFAEEASASKIAEVLDRMGSDILEDAFFRKLVARHLIQHADAVRDALAPFDSGKRQAGGV